MAGTRITQPRSWGAMTGRRYGSFANKEEGARDAPTMFASLLGAEDMYVDLYGAEGMTAGLRGGEGQYVDLKGA